MKIWWCRWWCMLWLTAGVPAVAFAHAVPVTLSPAPNSTWAQAPREVALRFSERVERHVSSLRVFDAQGRCVDTGSTSVAAGAPWLYGVTLRPVPAGTYTVAWRVMSADDGHVTEGAYVFVVGEAATATPSRPGDSAIETGGLGLFGRWLAMLGAVMLLGTLTMLWVFGRPRSSQNLSPVAVLLCLAAVVLGTAVALLAKAHQIAPEAGAWQAVGVLMHTAVGQVWAAKVGLSLLLAGTVIAFWPALGRGRWVWYLGILLALLVLLLDAMVSHSAATVERNGLALGVQMLHLLGMALWVGGLGYFATLFWRGPWREPVVVRELAWAMPTFSLLAAGAVGLLTLSGIYMARLHLNSLASLASTSYGRLLIAKLAIVAAMGALGGYHHVVAHRRILQSLDHPAGDGSGVKRRFHQTLQLEALLGVLALFIAALLCSTAPPPGDRVAAATPFQQARARDDVQLALEIWPGRPGFNTIRLRVTDRSGQPLGDVMAGLLQLVSTDVEVGPLAVTLDQESPGAFVKTGVLLGVEGHWRGRLTVQRQGAFDLHESFEFSLSTASNQHTHRPMPTSLGGVMGVVALGLIGMTVLLVLTSRWRRHQALRLLAHVHQTPSSHPQRRS